MHPLHRWVRTISVFALAGVLIAAVAFAKQTESRRTAVVHVAVTDPHGRYISGLEKKDFNLFADKLRTEITLFDTGGPASIAIVLDASRSIPADKLAATSGWAESFVKNGSKNEYLVVAFDEKPRIVRDWTSTYTELSAALSSIETASRRGTALFDATGLALEKLKTRSLSKRVIIVFSDGQDTKSKLKLNQVRGRLRESDVIVYAVDFVTRDQSDPSFNTENQNGLRDLAAVTGGRTFFSKTKWEFAESAETLSVELQQQYTLGFPLSQTADSKSHRIRIEASHEKTPPFTVRVKPELFDPKS
jgi:VWFA-related protein